MTLFRTTLRETAALVLAVYLQPARILIGQHWPLENVQLPALLLDLRDEDKSTDNKNGEPSFAVRATMVVRAREVVTSEPGAAPWGADHGRAIEAVCDGWIERIQDALLGDPRFISIKAGPDDDGTAMTVQAVRVQTMVDTSSEQMVAEVMVTFTLAWDEDYPPRIEDSLAGVRLRIDAIDPQDPNGTYPQAEGFPAAAPPPRTHGPDGRAEAGADITLPTQP